MHRDLKTNNVFRCTAGDVLKLGAPQPLLLLCAIMCQDTCWRLRPHSAHLQVHSSQMLLCGSHLHEVQLKNKKQLGRAVFRHTQNHMTFQILASSTLLSAVR